MIKLVIWSLVYLPLIGVLAVTAYEAYSNIKESK